jgi:molecular chaperone GrpE
MTHSFEEERPEAASATAEPAAAPASREDEELRQRYLRLMADLENLRKRQATQIAHELARAKASAFADLLPALDSLAHARTAGLSSVETMRDALAAIEQQIFSALQKQGVERIDANEGPLDPRYHEAVAAVPSTGQPEGHIVTCVRPGYRVDGRLLRPAQVVVAAAPPQEESNP